MVEHVRRGNEAAFEVIYDRYHRPLLGYCRHLTGSLGEAEDVLQQTFVAAYKALRTGDGRLELRPWLYTVARNTCISELRKRGARPEQPVGDGHSAGQGSSSLQEAEQRAEVRETVRDLVRLPEEQRSALVLSEIGDLSHKEVASVLGCERVKVKSLVHQARQGLSERRRARETPCEDVRAELSVLRGGSLRRSWLQLHVRRCPGCREYREEVRRQRALIGLTVPIPSLGLRRGVLATTGASGGAGSGAVGAGGTIGVGTAASGGAAAGGGAALGGGGAAVGGGIFGTLASSAAAKAAVGVALAGGAAVGGGLAVHGERSSLQDARRTTQPSTPADRAAAPDAERAVGPATTTDDEETQPSDSSTTTEVEEAPPASEPPGASGERGSEPDRRANDEERAEARERFSATQDPRSGGREKDAQSDRSNGASRSSVARTKDNDALEDAGKLDDKVKRATESRRVTRAVEERANSIADDDP